MISNDQAWVSLTDEFATAALNGAWLPALERFAAATGSRAGELVGFGQEAAVPFNLMTNVDPQATVDFVASGGGDPALNPRASAGMRVPELTVVAEADFLDPHEHRRNSHYREWAWPYDLPYACLTPLLKRPDMLIGLAVGRSAREGHITSDQRHVFGTIAPHVRAAVRTQLLLEDQGAALLAGLFESVSLAVFVCDADARITALTAGAEALLREGTRLRSRSNHLCAAQEAETGALQVAVAAAALGLSRPGAPLMQTLVLHARRLPRAPLVVDVVPVARAEMYFLGTRPRALVIAGRNRRQPAQTALMLQHAFGLTVAEAEVALQLTAGCRADAIAAQRGVSVSTVRAQIKSVLAKCGVSSQVELVALIDRLQ